jgi:hypothetical protein
MEEIPYTGVPPSISCRNVHSEDRETRPLGAGHDQGADIGD